MTQVNEIELTTLGLVHVAPPTVAVAPLKKPVPAIVIVVPPAVVPLLAVIPEMVGASSFVIVPVAAAVEIVAPLGFEIVRVNVSFPSAVESAAMGTEIVPDAEPAAIVRVPVVDV